MGETARLRDSLLEGVAALRRPVPVSFEFFPPDDAVMEQTLWASVQRLAPLAPRFVSVTYGADGSTRERTHNVVMRMLRETTLTPAAPHLTCVGRVARGRSSESHAVTGTRASATSSRCAATRRRGRRGYRPQPGGFDYAVDLVRGLRTVGDFDISVAAYPEVHPEAPERGLRLREPARKIDAGATRAITQFFFDTDAFLRFRDRCASSGIAAQIVPGILPITRFPQMLRFAERCGAACRPGFANASTASTTTRKRVA